VTKPSPKPTAKLVAKKVAVKASPSKPTDAKLNLTLKDDKSAKLALRRKKIQEIKNNYESPSKNDEDNFDNYRLPIIGRTRFNDADLNEFRAIINKKLAEAREELNFYQDQMKESEMNDDDIKFSGMEDGGHTNDKEHLSAMANRQVKFIQNLEGALVRIENKTYGICRMTGNLIDKKRLLAVPHATLSMEAKTGGKKK
jgi:RNA polymerase-binding transcription factor DksA